MAKKITDEFERSTYEDDSRTIRKATAEIDAYIILSHCSVKKQRLIEKQFDKFFDKAHQIATEDD